MIRCQYNSMYIVYTIYVTKEKVKQRIQRIIFFGRFLPPTKMILRIIFNANTIVSYILDLE